MASATRLRPLLRLASRRFSTSVSRPYALPAEIRFLPRFLQPTTYVPNWGQSRGSKAAVKAKGVKPWNPATWFIWMFIIIGSEAIHTINLKHGHADFMVKTEARIAALREVLKRLQDGEEVDVEKILGTGNPTDEAEWAEVMRELEEHGEAWHTKQAEENQEATAREEDAEQSKAKVEALQRRRNRTAEEEALQQRRNLTAKDYGL